MKGKRRFEPWPVAQAAALLAMIGISLAFYFVARTHPDRVVAQDAGSLRVAR